VEIRAAHQIEALSVEHAASSASRSNAILLLGLFKPFQLAADIDEDEADRPARAAVSR